MATSKKKVSKKKVGGKTGRPSKFDKIDKAQIEKLARKGWTDAEMADFHGVTDRTWDNWKKAHPEFFRSLKDWKAEADEKVERSLFERAAGYTHPEEKIFQHEGRVVRAETTKHYPPDSTAMIFWLKNRRPEDWRDKHEVSHPIDEAGLDEVGEAILARMKAEGIDLSKLKG